MATWKQIMWAKNERRKEKAAATREYKKMKARDERTAGRKANALRKFLDWRVSVATWKKWGFTEAQGDQIIEAQDNACAICRHTFVRKPHVDHCHTTGKYRDVTCHTCNLILGKLEVYAHLLGRMAHYIDWHKEHPSGIQADGTVLTFATVETPDFVPVETVYPKDCPIDPSDMYKGDPAKMVIDEEGYVTFKDDEYE